MLHRLEAAKQFAAENAADLRTIELDVASPESADRTIKTIIDKDDRLDIVIHNAGHMVFGAAEAFAPEQLLQVCDTNVLSTQCVNRAAQCRRPTQQGATATICRRKLQR